jgi:polyribonucleotide nucleotidyltransferase
LKEGEQLLVKVINIDPSGKIRLSRKVLIEPPEGGTSSGGEGGGAPRSEGDRPRREGAYQGGRREGGFRGGGGGGDRDRGPRDRGERGRSEGPDRRPEGSDRPDRPRDDEQPAEKS